jgi:5'-3' exonuclease
MHSGYKEGRSPVRLNRNVHNLSEIEEAENKTNQFVRLVEYLNNMPVMQLMQDNVEADDIVAKICRMEYFKGTIKIIVSADKDFIQLCDSETLLMRPIQKEVLNERRIVKEYKIHPNNFAIARAIVGDKSDNLDGVRGVGLPTVAKRFPFLEDKKSYLLTDIIKHCNENLNETKVYNDIINKEEQISLNYKMMQLYIPSLSPQSSKIIRETVEKFEPTFSHTTVMCKMIRDGFTDFNWDSLFQTFRFIVSEHNKNKKN